MTTIKEYAEQAERDFHEKHPDAGDQFDAVEIVRQFIGTGTGPADVLARDAFEFVLGVWNTGYDDE